MKDPRRLTEEGSALEVALLRSARSRRPAAGSSSRALAALGLAGTTISAGTLGASSASAMSGSTLATSTAGSKVATKASMALAKWAGIGVVSGLCAMGGVHLTQRVLQTPSRTTSVVDEATRRAGPAAPTPRTAGSAVLPEEEFVSPAPATAEPVKASKPLRLAPLGGGAAGNDKHALSEVEETAPAGDTASLLPEISLLDTARTSLATGKADVALAALNRYEKEFPRGRLEPEARYLRIQALLAQGDRETAARVARHFLAQAPESVHAKRIRALLNFTPALVP